MGVNMFCAGCGSKIENNSYFCVTCGRRVTYTRGETNIKKNETEYSYGQGGHMNATGSFGDWNNSEGIFKVTYEEDRPRNDNTDYQRPDYSQYAKDNYFGYQEQNAYPPTFRYPQGNSYYPNPVNSQMASGKAGLFILFGFLMFIPVALLIHSVSFWNSDEVRLLVLLKSLVSDGDLRQMQIIDDIFIGMDFFLGLAFLADLYVWKSKHPGVSFGFFSFFVFLSLAIHFLLCGYIKEDEKSTLVLILCIVAVVQLIMTVKGCQLASVLKRNGAFPSKNRRVY